METFTNPYFVLFGVVGLGLLLGRIPLAGIRFDTSAVLFVALGAGHLGLTLPGGAGTLGLILFMYCLGITAGPSFFGTVVNRGSSLSWIAAAVILTAVGVTWAGAVIFGVPKDLVVGMFAGALTSTPALAAGLEALQGGGLASVGYGITYPFGVIGVVLFVQVLPRLLKADLGSLARKLESERSGSGEVGRALVRVTNSGITGEDIASLPFLDGINCRASRRLAGKVLVPLSYGAVFEQDQVLLIVGDTEQLDRAVEHLGERARGGLVDYLREETADAVITARAMTGKTLGSLHTLKNYGVTVTRITRNGVTFVPSYRDRIEHQDMVKIVGDTDAIAAFTAACGHSARAMFETDLLSLAIGIIGGILIGLVKIPLGGLGTVSLGMAGGPLVAGLLLGHFGRIGRIAGRIPHGSRSLMMDLGIALFLANAGVKAGGLFGPTLAQYGVQLVVLGALITLAPMITGYLLARSAAGLNLLAALGGICGSMTSTPALAALKSRTDSQVPVISYATAYPLALILMVLCTQLLVKLLG